MGGGGWPGHACAKQGTCAKTHRLCFTLRVPDIESRLAVSDSRPAAAGRGWSRDRRAITAVFLTHGIVFASWTAHIPHVKAALGLTDGGLGETLLGAPAGSVTAMMGSTYLLPRLGSRRLVRLCLLGYCTVGVLVGMAHSMAQLFLALFLWGGFQGALDVAMNTQAIAVERAAGRPVMSALHGTWSIGAFSGAALGALGVAVGLPLSAQLACLAVLVLPLAEAQGRHLLADAANDDPADPAGRGWRFSPALLVLGGIGFAALLCEGAAADWAAVFMRGPAHAGAGTAGLGYACFSMTMVVIRLFGNRLLTRFPAHRLLPALAVLSTVGFSAGLAAPGTVAGLVGFGCLALGLASVVPTLFSAAGRLPGMHPGTSVATVATFGWAGFVCGPPLIGQLAQLSGLRVGLALLPACTAFIALATATVRALRAPVPGPAEAAEAGRAGPAAVT